MLNLDDWGYTNDLLHPITDAPDQAQYTDSEQTLAELHKRKNKETKWTCTFENCGVSYDSAGSFRNHKYKKRKEGEDHHTSKPDEELIVLIKNAKKRVMKSRNKVVRSFSK